MELEDEGIHIYIYIHCTYIYIYYVHIYLSHNIFHISTGANKTRSTTSLKLTCLPLKIGQAFPKGSRIVFLCHPFSGANLLIVLGIFREGNHPNSPFSFNMAPSIRQFWGGNCGKLERHQPPVGKSP